MGAIHEDRLVQRVRTKLESLVQDPNAQASMSLELAVHNIVHAMQSYVAILVEEDQRSAVLDRMDLVERWPYDAAIDSILLTRSDFVWPDEISQEEVQEAVGSSPKARSFNAQAVAIVLLAHRQVLSDLKRQAIALDAGFPHHFLISGLRDGPKDGMRHSAGQFTGLPIVEYGNKTRVQLIVPKELDVEQRSMQLELPLEGIQEELINTLRALLGPMSLRHWAAMQHGLSVGGGRLGRYVWNLEQHMRVLGYSERACRDPRVQDESIRTVSAFTSLEIVIKQKPKELRGPIFAKILEGRRVAEERSVLEGMILELHPILYAGVRNPTTGELGSNWYPQAPGIPRIDHTKRPHAIALGLILPIRWRWAWLEGRDFIGLSGSSLLRAAGIQYNKHEPGRTWKRLKDNLDELQRVDGLGSYEWSEYPWTLAGVCKLRPPQWARDRTIHGLVPPEVMPRQLPTTGSELVLWRKKRGISQVQLAKELNVGLRTVKRAEASEHNKLGPAISQAFQRIGHLPPLLTQSSKQAERI